MYARRGRSLPVLQRWLEGYGPAGQAEVARKILHLASAIVPLIYVFLSREDMLRLLWAGTVVALLIEFVRHWSPVFQRSFRAAVGFMVREREWGRITGATYVMLGALLSVWLFPKPLAIAVMLIVSISDSAASLVGIRYGRAQFLGKSLAGSLAFFVTALVILWVALPEQKGLGFLAALVAAVVEALPAARLGRFEINDNLTIPLLTGAVILGIERLAP